MAPHKAEEVDRAPDKLPSRPACRPVFVTSLSQCLLSGSGCSCQVAMGLCHCVLVVTEATGCIGRRVAVDRERSLEFAYGCVLLEVLLDFLGRLSWPATHHHAWCLTSCRVSGLAYACTVHAAAWGLCHPVFACTETCFGSFMDGLPGRSLSHPCVMCVSCGGFCLCAQRSKMRHALGNQAVQCAAV